MSKKKETDPKILKKYCQLIDKDFQKYKVSVTGYTNNIMNTVNQMRMVEETPIINTYQ